MPYKEVFDVSEGDIVILTSGGCETTIHEVVLAIKDFNIDELRRKFCREVGERKGKTRINFSSCWYNHFIIWLVRRKYARWVEYKVVPLPDIRNW